LACLEKHEIALMVTDQRMPGKSGLQLIAEVQNLLPLLPIIMVSGYLESETVRDLIRQGIGGVFSKPLNIFALLKKTEELLAQRVEAPARLEQEIGEANEASLSVKCWAFPGRSARADSFLEALQRQRNFTRILLLVGAPGLPFYEICERLVLKEDGSEKLWFTNDVSEPARWPTSLAQTTAGKSALLVFGPAVILDEEARNAAVQLTEGMPGARGVFCLQASVDELLDEGQIDEEFYLFLGSTEVAVPSLRDMREDIPDISRHLARIQEPARQLEPLAYAFLTQQKWSRNHEELAQVIAHAAVSQPTGPLTREVLRKVMAGETIQAAPSPADAQAAFLAQSKESYLRAVRLLAGGNEACIAKVIGVQLGTEVAS